MKYYDKDMTSTQKYVMSPKNKRRLPFTKCSIFWCKQRLFKDGWCQSHHYRQTRYGDPFYSVLGTIVKIPKEYKTCSIFFCNEVMRRNGYCVKHDFQIKTHGDPFYNVLGRVLYRECKEPGCNGIPHAFGFCRPHYVRTDYYHKMVKTTNSKPENKQRLSTWNKSRNQMLRYKCYVVYSKRLSNSDIPCCNCCGENSSIQFLAVNHINGRKDLPEKEKYLTGMELVRHLVKNNYPEGIEILCHNCNSADGYYGICPHKLKRLLQKSDCERCKVNFI